MPEEGKEVWGKREEDKEAETKIKWKEFDFLPGVNYVHSEV